MESALWPMTLLGLSLLLLLAAALVFLYLHSLKALRRQQEEQTAFLTQATTITVQLAQNAQDSASALVRASRELVAETLATAIAELDRQQALVQKAMDLSLTRSLDGSNKAQERLSTSLNSALALLGTKDPLAYQQVISPVLPLPEGGEPYTAVDEDYERQLNEAAALLERMGVVNDGGAGPRPYTVAAS